jgi:hypothetical protein
MLIVPRPMTVGPLLDLISYIDGAGAQDHDPASILLRADEVFE